MYAACHVKRTVLECRATWVHVVGSGEKLLCCVEFICRLMYGPGLPVSLSQTPSVHGCILCPTVSDGVRGQICACVPRGI